VGGPVVNRILDLLTRHEVVFKHLNHEETRTSEDSARVRGEPLAHGAKAIVLKVDDRFLLFVMSAARRLDSGRIRQHFGARKSRFATPEELMSLTGLVPGSVPPFGAPILDLPLFVDPSVFDNDRVAFNAGSLTESIILSSEDYRRVANPTVLAFAGPNPKSSSDE
jgi:prolyl-tRNA editing enzyme YbaK/EbsC (Cys-tRNA(Pro) deacylase)